ncbi:MAG: YitT family protein [Atopobiaceae bacterium]|nr:YitT family protein [Atopobiaceae bacterium]MDD4381216.1 YitT family protein [Atopobiaceae bacterium]
MPIISYQEESSPEQIKAAEEVSAQREGRGRLRFFVMLNLRLLITAFGIILFKAPNHFALGGTSGLSIILSTLFPTLPVSAFMWILNAVLVGLGLVFLDHRTMGWTIYASFALSAYTSILELAIPMAAPLTHDTLLELCFAVLLPAIGSAIVFNVGASTGGTDIVAMILKRRTSLEIGKALMVSDGVIVGVAFLLYGPQTGLYCVLGLIAKAFVVDNVIESLNLRKVCTVISHDPEAVLGFLVRTLDRTATVRDAVGGFSMQPEEEVVAVLTRREAALLQMWLRRHDPTAFMTMVNSSEILGKGFRSV